MSNSIKRAYNILKYIILLCYIVILVVAITVLHLGIIGTILYMTSYIFFAICNVAISDIYKQL